MRDRVDADAPAGTLVLRDRERAVGGRFDDRVADAREVGHLTPVGVVAAGALRAAFDDVAGDGARCEAVPVLRAPTELVDERADDQARVGAATRDHDLRTAVEGFRDREGAQVDVRAGDAIAHLGERRAGVEVRERLAGSHELIDVAHHVVALDDRDLHPGQAVAAAGLDHRVLARHRVDPASVRDDLDALLGELGQDAIHQGHEVRRVALVRVARPELLHDAHRHLGEVVERQVVQGTLA